MAGTQVPHPKTEVVPMGLTVGAPFDHVGVEFTGKAVTEDEERSRVYVLSLDKADDLVRRITYTVQQLRSQASG